MQAAVLDHLRARLLRAKREQGVFTGLPALDAALVQHGLAVGAIHEVLSVGSESHARQFATLLAKSCLKAGAIAWCSRRSSDGTWYPPAAAMLGIPAERLLVLHAPNDKETLWATAECLRSRGVNVTIAPIRQTLTSLDARRLQLAAEAGGGVGILLRDSAARSMHYAAATRWLIEPAHGEPHLQRWRATLIHGHGGQVDSSILLEHHRETHRLRAFEELADQPHQTQASRATG